MKSGWVRFSVADEMVKQSVANAAAVDAVSPATRAEFDNFLGQLGNKGPRTKAQRDVCPNLTTYHSNRNEVGDCPLEPRGTQPTRAEPLTMSFRAATKP